MKCEEFETIVGDLARGRGLEESARRDAEAHAGGCGECAARLAAERSLTLALRAFAANQEGLGAPARVEAALFEAYGRRLAARPAARRTFSWPRWAFAAAAALALVAAGVWLARPRPVVVPSIAKSRPAVVPQPPRPRTAETPVSAAQPVVRAARRRTAARPRLAATRFYPLTPAASPVDVQGGAVVRIGMPRAALASFGWPLDPDDPGGRVEADVVLDNDTGMVRAIRFVSGQP